MLRSKTPSFITELPLKTSTADEVTLTIRFEAGKHLFNACMGESLRRLGLMRQSKDWQLIREMPKFLGKDEKGKPVPNKERRDLIKRTIERFNFTAYSIQKYAEQCRDSCWIGNHLGSHDTQTLSLRAFSAVQMYAFGKGGRPRFKRHRGINSIEGKGDTVIRYRSEPVKAIHWAGLVLPLILDKKDKKEWQKQALSSKTKYVRVVRRKIKGNDRWYCQLVQEGAVPKVRETKDDVVGLDIGPSTIAAVSGEDAILEQFCPSIEHPWKEIRRIQRGMDRSRRATNPDNYNENGTVKKGKKRWIRSERYKRRQRHKAELERRLASERRRSHGELVNRIFAQGTTVKTEKLSYRAFQNNYGRSVTVRAPGMLVSELRRKAVSAGGKVIEIKTRNTKLSQLDHTTEQYVKKPLNQRIHIFGDGTTEPVQRDLYSAFLAMCCSQDSLDIGQVKKTWPSAEPLLRRAMLRVNEPTSGEGFPLSHVLCNVREGRPSKKDSRSVEAIDVVAQARAIERLNNGTFKIL